MLFRGQHLGKYKIMAPLGSGGFGTVYLAEDTWINKKVAIKVPHKQSVKFAELLREPRLLASLNHPNIVNITTAEKQSNLFFIVMEYVAGKTLDHIIETEGQLELHRALDYACQICNAIDHAHRQGVIHRDLRPANVMVSKNNLLKVTDFGTSRFLEIAAHGTTVIGSPPYMAPEQFKGMAVFASDVYSLGITLYQMLTGVLPYQAPAPADLEKLFKGELVSSPRSRNHKIPEAVSDIVMQALAPEVADRYQSAGDMLDDLLALRPDPDKYSTHSSDNVRINATKDTNGQSSTEDKKLPPEDAERMKKRLLARETPLAGFCWHCHKPLHARSSCCPFCGENQ